MWLVDKIVIPLSGDTAADKTSDFLLFVNVWISSRFGSTNSPVQPIFPIKMSLINQSHYLLPSPEIA